MSKVTILIGAAAQGLGITDFRTHQSESERDHWMRIGSWIENQLALRERRQEEKLSQQMELISGP